MAVLRGFKEGAEFIADCRGARNIQQLKLFWSMAALVEEATDRPREQVKKDLCRALGYVDYEVDRDGSVHVWPKSIAVESMLQRDFDDFFRKGIEVMAGWIGADQKDVLRRFNELAADKRYEGMRHG